MSVYARAAARILAQETTSKPVCPNCKQWQYRGSGGYLDCYQDCAARGFAPKVPNPPPQVQRGDAPRSVLQPKAGGVISIPDPRTATADQIRRFVEVANLDQLIQFAQANDPNGIYGHADEEGDPRDPVENEQYLRQVIAEWIQDIESVGSDQP